MIRTKVKTREETMLQVVNTDMDQLLSNLTGKEKPRDSGSMSFAAGLSIDGPESGSIPQITNFLTSEFAQFAKLSEEKDHFMDLTAKEQKKRDEAIREEGRAEARAQGLFGLNLLMKLRLLIVFLGRI